MTDYEHRVSMKWNEIPKTEWNNQFDKLRIDIIDAPNYSDLLNYIPEFGEATWEDSPRTHYSDSEREACVADMFAGKYVPTALETVNITIRVTGIDICDVTHFLRHRMFSFSAQCTGDRDLRHDPIVIKPSIIANDEFLNRFLDIVDQAKQLYADMTDSKEVTILDARTILPRCTETFYYIKGPLNAWIAFIKARTDIQIQPKSDVIMAMRIYEKLCDLYPPFKGSIDITGPDWWYINTVNSKRSSNMMKPYGPNIEHVKDWKPEDFVYGDKTIGDFPGDEQFLEILRVHNQNYGKE